MSILLIYRRGKPALENGHALATLPAALDCHFRFPCDFWRRRVGGRWTRLHQSGLAASGLVIAYVFLVFHIAGTTLNY
ncbi:hypothetical protein [Methylosinus sp. Sm6]|uniref:hypothetical protein n=1 Tax=Methylosinus sp. Sm6 TaxID=2866948 RepID=UPI001C999FC2|nr:hypothetical protein [Methylosinus sp. Sm6]MBY6242866.1 hypothetical protein [Methylosinus sp. Sm6]